MRRCLGAVGGGRLGAADGSLQWIKVDDDGALILEVDGHSPQVAEILAERGDN